MSINLLTNNCHAKYELELLLMVQVKYWQLTVRGQMHLINILLLLVLLMMELLLTWLPDISLTSIHFISFKIRAAIKTRKLCYLLQRWPRDAPTKV